MNEQIKYVHTNIIAYNWKKLAKFYIDVFDCKPVYPERNLSGNWLDELTKIPQATIRGIHLKLPGYRDGPTLEIFEYNSLTPKSKSQSINDQGFGHIAFHVENVEAVVDKILASGGKKYGDIVEKEIDGIGILKAIYTRDPEGNIIEIQNWKQG